MAGSVSSRGGGKGDGAGADDEEEEEEEEDEEEGDEEDERARGRFVERAEDVGDVAAHGRRRVDELGGGGG